MAHISELSEEKRILVRNAINRITDIANSLLEKSKPHSTEATLDDKKDNLETTLLAALVDSVISEKRIQIRENSSVNIQAYLEESYGLFAKINPTELKRVLSNTINNSIEAFDTLRGGCIDVFLTADANSVILKIKDNGKGIPQHILDQLGQRGVSHGKEGTQSGSGLGVYHAKKTIESFGGLFEIENNKSGQGVTISLSLPKAQPPEWFVQELKVTEGQVIVAVDDDNSVLEVWRQRLNSFINSSRLSLVTCTSSACLADWLQKNPELMRSAIYLMDYELLGQKKNGLDLIEEHHISQTAILVSSRYEEPLIKKRCAELGVKLIPKGMAPIVPITVDLKAQRYDGVLIDNDPLVLMVWNLGAKEYNKSVLCFNSEAEFNQAAAVIDKSSPVYVDVDLGQGIQGQDVAARISASGFKFIHLATGFEAQSIAKPEFIASVVGKDFPL